MEDQTLYQVLYQMLGSTQAQTLLWVNQDGTLGAQAGVDLPSKEDLGILFAQVAEAFQHIMGGGERALFFLYESAYRRYAFVSAYKQPLLAAIYLHQISPPPPLGMTRYLLRSLYQDVLRELPVSVKADAPVRASGRASRGRISANLSRVDTHGAHSPALYQALSSTCQETDAKLLMAIDKSGAVIEAYGELEESPATLGALASASLAEFTEVERATHLPMKKAHVLLDGGKNSIMIFKGSASDLTFISIVPMLVGNIGLSYAMTSRLSEKTWDIVKNASAPSLTLPGTGELLLGDWGNDDFDASVYRK